MERLIPGEYYHIFNHANGFEDLFREEENFRFFLEKYQLSCDAAVETFAFCLMPNHYHTLIRVKTHEELIAAKIIEGEMEDIQISNAISRQLSRFFSSYTQAFNKVYHRRGSMFIKNYKRKRIDDESYLRELVLYIHLNPVKHGFRNTPENWKWNSFTMASPEQLNFYHQLFGGETNYLEAIERKRKKLLFVDEFDDIVTLAEL
ncbi:MAG: transposase [Bacteroidota bacterium]|nr:transposase [Bacteroidota bacterium]MDX5430527.1 transposase [Bacteroidota bacterium]MDX5469280.1 transposase [Bacteroidota bacterium]